ncbi:MAG TPA: hypothetical protein VHF23_03280 [Gaiellaceae bacterium]|nr:hypothetical protein [Gaiellaceae bacterium]
MSTTPPQPPPSQSYDRPYYGSPLPLPSLNGELIIFMLAWLVVFIVTLAADSVDWPAFVTATIVLASAYVLSRGIAKASRVHEGR